MDVSLSTGMSECLHSMIAVSPPCGQGRDHRAFMKPHSVTFTISYWLYKDLGKEGTP